MKRYVTVFAAMAVLILSGSAKGKQVSGSISGPNPVSPSTTVAYQSYIDFNWTCDGCWPLGNRQGPRIQVLCYQNQVLVYADAQPADQVFLLGGGLSQWVINGGGLAHCTADLYYWTYTGGGQQFNFIASVDFDAAG